MDGTEIWIGGKIGTGDHRYKTFGPNGSLISSEGMSPGAVSAFFIGDRFFVALTAYVPGPEAKEYEFTSSLPVARLGILWPRLMPPLETERPLADHAEALSSPKPRSYRRNSTGSHPLQETLKGEWQRGFALKLQAIAFRRNGGVMTCPKEPAVRHGVEILVLYSARCAPTCVSSVKDEPVFSYH